MLALSQRQRAGLTMSSTRSIVTARYAASLRIGDDVQPAAFMGAQSRDEAFQEARDSARIVHEKTGENVSVTVSEILGGVVLEKAPDGYVLATVGRDAFYIDEYEACAARASVLRGLAAGGTEPWGYRRT